MTSTEDTAAPAAAATIFDVPQDIWESYLFNYLNVCEIAQTARTCRHFRHYADAYRHSTAYGRHLILKGLHSVRASLISWYFREGLHMDDGSFLDLLEQIDKYLPQLCISYHNLPAAAVDGRKPAAIIQKWGPTEIATCLISLATELDSDKWNESSAAINWGLRVLKLDTLRRVLFASKPCDVLTEIAKTPQQKVYAIAVGKIFTVLRNRLAEKRKRGDGSAEECMWEEAKLCTTTSSAVGFMKPSLYTSRVEASELESLEFILAGNALAHAHYLDKTIVETCDQAKYFRALRFMFELNPQLKEVSAPSSTVFNQLGLVGPARKVVAVEKFFTVARDFVLTLFSKGAIWRRQRRYRTPP